MRSDEPPQKPIDEVAPLLLDVQENLDGENGLSDLARQYGCSPFHFHRLFTSAVGETPKQHVERLRLERAAYKLAITADSVLVIALAVGFKNHETFSRAFKRALGRTPAAFRRACKAAQTERLERNRAFCGDGCRLSEVRFVLLPPATLLAVRNHGAYAELTPPFVKGDALWSSLAAWAKRRGFAYEPLAYTISYDDPTMTPKSLQRLDACIPIGETVIARGRFRRLDFAGGRYAGIEHVGPLTTIDQAYRNLADGVRRSSRYRLDEGPPIQIFRQVHLNGDPSANVTEVYFPVRPSR
jgi:AraC family transcriptional regulator